MLYAHVLNQLEALIPQFGLQESAARLIGAFELLSKESLAIPPGRCRRDFSTINEDGIPFQISLGLGPGNPALQFLGEAGDPGLSTVERMILNRERMGSMAALLGCERELSGCQRLLDALAPGTSTELAAAQGGTFWIGVSALAGEPPRLQIYINSCWGGEASGRSRLDAFAANFDARAQWTSHQGFLEDRMRPLGVSLTIGEDRSPSGRIYMRGYGNPLRYYEHLARQVAGDACARTLRDSAQTLLADDIPYPTRSVVCSFGFGDGVATDFKCEFCAHCIFASDAQAVSRCSAWLAPQQTHLDAYSSILHALAKGGINESTQGLHSFVGLGYKRQQPYSTLYLNPGAPASIGEESEWANEI